MQLDQFMKELSEDYLPEIVILFFPEEAMKCDFENRKDLNKDLYTQSPKGEERFVDVLQEVSYKHPSTSVLLIHIESQQDKKFDFSSRMFGYLCLLYSREIERMRKDSFSYAEFVGWQNQKRMLSFAFCNYKDNEAISCEEYKIGSTRTYLSCGYTTIKLPMLSAKEYLQKDNPVVCALAVFMDKDSMSTAELKAECYRKLLSYKNKLSSRQIDLIVYAVETYLSLTEQEKRVYQQLISKIYPEVSELIINPIEERGFKRGEESGMQRSIQQILAYRFQEVPEKLQEKISFLTDVNKLQNLLEASLKVESIDELMLDSFFD